MQDFDALAAIEEQALAARLGGGGGGVGVGVIVAVGAVMNNAGAPNL